MKTDALFYDIRSKENIKLLEVNPEIRVKFQSKYYNFQDKLFFEFMENCGGIVIDNWIRLYGCGALNVITKNEKIKNEFEFDIMMGEDILGGIFALKNNVVYYYAPDLLKWECFDVYYANFMNWLINDSQNVNLFYKDYRWNGWKQDCENLNINQGISFYPLLVSKCDIEQRSKKVISMDELIKINI